ncbi:Aste57867_4602 [Aphanomyces stellatus]|uniref:Aste57867_4602 protein n=1 Tax=Aphanomyces stellatus TaxID=120398 RepID=A0A485KC10_9STRA|nr:hypothetical protein As57867_004589 [Aphanomyces stellatus]VFT81707.1 Aste57867_4602 [Aphanomyces stellatus]
MADIALSFAADFPTTTTQSALPCIGPQGIYLRQNQTDYAALAKVTKCAVDFTASVQDGNSAMLSQDALLPTDVPAPRLWSHQDPGTSKNRNMAIHVTPGGGLEPVPWGQCPKASTQTMGITIPCEQTTTEAFLPTPTTQMAKWLGAIATNKTQRIVVVPNSTSNAANGTTHAPSTSAPTTTPTPSNVMAADTRVGIITAIAGVVVAALAVVAFIVCARRRKRQSPRGQFLEVMTPSGVNPPVALHPVRLDPSNERTPQRSPRQLPSLLDTTGPSTESMGNMSPDIEANNRLRGSNLDRARRSTGLPPSLVLQSRLSLPSLSSAYALTQLKQTPRLDFHAIKCIDDIASTTSTIVYYGQYYAREVAIKTFRAGARPTQDAVNQFADEIRLMSTFNHPNIVKLVGFACLSNVDTLTAVTEFLPQGNLATFLVENPDLEWANKAPLALDIVQALQYLHVLLEPVVIHRDLKTHNVLLDWPHAKLSGFGVSRQARDDETLTAGVGSGFYMAPEVLRSDGRYSVQADMYSFGCILVELDTQKPLFSELRQQPIVILQRILTQGLTPTMSPTCPELIRDLAHQCLHPDPSERPTAMDAFRFIELYMNPREVDGRLL